MSINAMENNTRVMTPTGHEGRVQLTRRERKFIADNDHVDFTMKVLGADGLIRHYKLSQLSVIEYDDAEVNPGHEFLLKLADLCEEYNVSFGYSCDDSGIDMYVNHNHVFTGFICDPEDVPKQLRDTVTNAN